MTALPPRLDIFVLLARRWILLAITCALGGGAAVAYALITPPWYAATLTVVPAHDTQNPLVSGLAASLPMDTGLSMDVQRIVAVFESASVADAVIDKFKLQERYGVQFREHARDALRQHCVSSSDTRSGVVRLTCEDRDPQHAVDIAAYFGEVGNQVFARVSASSAREERKFLESQVGNAQTEVDEASKKLREFELEHKIVDLPEQSKAVITAMASLQGELVSKQIDLSYLTSFSARTESSVQQLQEQISIMQAKLKQLEESSTVAPATATDKFFPEAMNVPGLRFELEQLLREQKIKETVFFLMTQRFEMARADEARDTSTFQILDTPTLPTFRSRPKRKKIVVVGILIGFAIGSLYVVGPPWWRRRFAES